MRYFVNIIYFAGIHKHAYKYQYTRISTTTTPTLNISLYYLVFYGHKGIQYYGQIDTNPWLGQLTIELQLRCEKMVHIIVMSPGLVPYLSPVFKSCFVQSQEPTIEKDKFSLTPRKNSDQELNKVKNIR